MNRGKLNMLSNCQLPLLTLQNRKPSPNGEKITLAQMTVKSPTALR